MVFYTSALITALIFYPIGLCLYNLLFHPLSSWPGPKLWSATRIPYILSTLKGRSIHDIRAMHEKYGDIVRVAPNELSFAKGQAWTDIFSHRPGHHEFPRNPVWWKPAPGSPPSIINVGPEDHARIRSVLSKAFSLKALADQEPVLQRNVALLISRFEELAGKHGVELDITKWYNYTTFDIIGDVATGETFDCLNTASYHWWVATIFNHFKASSYLACIRFYPALEWLLLKFIPRKMREVQRAHYEEGASKVRRRLEKGRDDNSSDFLSLVLKNNSANGMKMDEIEATFNLIFFAGSETTATTLSGATNGLIRHPEVQTRLRAELHETFRDPSQMTFSELQKLPYLNAVIEEALRMYPTLPSGLPRLVPEGGDTVCGEMIPGGTHVQVHTWSLNRSSRYFAAPNTFSPERWLTESSTSEFLNDQKDSLKPFGAGPRMCVGMTFAYNEMRLILARVLYEFKLEQVGELLDWDKLNAWGATEKQAMIVKVVPSN